MGSTVRPQCSLDGEVAGLQVLGGSAGERYQRLGTEGLLSSLRMTG